MQESLLEPTLPFCPDDPFPGEVTGNEGKRHVDANRQKQGLPGNRQAADTEEETAEWTVQEEHCQRIDGNHDQRVTVVALRQIPPDEYHGSARSDPEKDTPREVTSPERYFQNLDSMVEDDLSIAVCGADGQIKAEWNSHMVNGIGADEAEEHRTEEEDGDRIHAKRLDRPIDEKGQPYGPSILSCLENLGEIYLHHDRVHHEEKANGNGD
jgi:hypothetical protein